VANESESDTEMSLDDFIRDAAAIGWFQELG
jgi:hypothetical protein